MNHLKEIRNSAGLTQMQLAVKVGTSPQDISRLENLDYLRCHSDTARALAQALNCTMDDLFQVALQPEPAPAGEPTR